MRCLGHGRVPGVAPEREDVPYGTPAHPRSRDAAMHLTLPHRGAAVESVNTAVEDREAWGNVARSW